MTPLPAMFVATRLVRLSAVDLAIIVIYFVLVLAIGFYLKRFATTGEDFFLAGREMTGQHLLAGQIDEITRPAFVEKPLQAAVGELRGRPVVEERRILRQRDEAQRSSSAEWIRAQRRPERSVR